MIDRFIAWVKESLGLGCKHLRTEARFRWEGEWGIYYNECLDCGAEDL